MSEEEGRWVGECRAAVRRGDLGAASQVYREVLGKVKGGWVGGWREWAEVLFCMGKREGGEKVLRFVLEKLELRKEEKVGGWVGGWVGGMHAWGLSWSTHPPAHPLTPSM